MPAVGAMGPGNRLRRQFFGRVPNLAVDHDCRLIMCIDETHDPGHQELLEALVQYPQAADYKSALLVSDFD